MDVVVGAEASQPQRSAVIIRVAYVGRGMPEYAAEPMIWPLCGAIVLV
ncbi:MAG: hypothetical protein ACXVVQ_17475 [Solirubrobacteraceae bacterium]